MSSPEAHSTATGRASLDAYRARLCRALSYIQENLGGELSLEGAAEAACFSKYHFHRIFSSALGESFADCVRRLRLERAARLLEQRPEMRITDIALASGFASSSVLSRIFAERFGSPPSRWRLERLAALRAMSRASPSSRGDLVGQGMWMVFGKRPNGEDIDAGDSLPFLRMLPGLRLASCLHIGSYGSGIQEAWQRLFIWAFPRGLVTPTSLMVGVSWDNPEICQVDRCRYSACLSIPKEIVPPPEILLQIFPPRSYLCQHFSGPDADFKVAYGNLYRIHLPASGFEPEDDPAIELYRRPPIEGSFDLDIAIPVRSLD